MKMTYAGPGPQSPAEFVASVRCLLSRWLQVAACAVLSVAAMATTASAETLLMPTRDARQGTPVVVWGVHTQPVGTVCALSFGDLTPPQPCTGIDPSYVAFPKTYGAQGTYTVTLTVGTESTTTTIQVFNPAVLSLDNNRSLGINMAIQDGLRYLWTNQDNRAANFPAGVTTFWNNSGFPYADTSLVVLAFENQGYTLIANAAPTGIFQKYIVRRGLNYVISNLNAVTLGITPGGGNPCVGVPAATFADCQGLAPPDDTGYTAAVAILGFAGSGALSRINTEVAGVTNGKTFGEILQRMVNALAWGQNDSGGLGRGGWDYNFNNAGRADGSTIGWDVLAILDAQAAGAVIPSFVIPEFKVLLSGAAGGGGILNSDGSFDYVADGSAASGNADGPQKTGIGLQGLFLIGEMVGSRVTSVRDNINSWWSGGPGTGGDGWVCGFDGDGNYVLAANKGCAYSMFNNFKGLRLMNIATLPGVGRPAGPGLQPANDWYADYQDWLVANQTSPDTTGGGSWSTMGFSCCGYGNALTAAIAELILSPVALVAPDALLFSTVGLSPLTATNPLRTSHTVTAFTQAVNNAPVPGVTINFRVLSGPNAGKAGGGTTGADGKTSFTYTDTAGPGTDEIQAFIGATLSSNKVLKIWGVACDVNNDGRVTNADLLLIRGRFNTVATGPTDRHDANGDGVINILDFGICRTRLTPP